ncbi:sigma-70 family RNA polymerase sigma factor [Tumidithrix helvetica PCC 7403]|uniref:sigma-70 family RNA polymerase sigma factor n=1 Tax=Tumidithrix helvetica TaxID=3457545 RepID=UPI003C8D3ED1
MLTVVFTKVAEFSQSDPDIILVRECLQGKSQSFRLLYQRHQKKVRSTLFQLCGSDGLDDLVQEVFLRAWKGLGKFKQTAQFSTWLYRITWNVACERRRTLAQGRSRNVSVDDTQLENLSDLASAKTTSTNTELMDMHYQDLVQRGLAELSLDHRTVLVLHDLEEIPQKEIAEILAVPIGTIKSRLFHARAGLRQFLESQGVEL